MATESRKESRFMVMSKEATAGTADTYQNFEFLTATMARPVPTHVWESNSNKLGSGQAGTKADLVGIYTPFSIKCQKPSEIAFLMSYALGTADSVATISAPNTTYNHQLLPLAVATLTLPTFSAYFVDGSGTSSMTHCIINDFQLTLGVGGTGVVDFTANGFCNLHSNVAGTLTILGAPSAWTTGANDAIVAASPLVNFAGCKIYMSTATEAVPLVQSVINMSAHDLAGSPEELTTLLNSIKIGYSNGLSAEALIRAGGGGVLNNQQRSAPGYTCELSFRKDDSTPSTTFDATTLAGTQKAIELQWLGKAIGGGYQNGIGIILPKVQFQDVSQDDETPINQTIPTMVFEDASKIPMYVYVQSAFAGGYNATLTA